MLYLLLGMVYNWPASQNQSFSYSGTYSGAFTVFISNSND